MANVKRPGKKSARATPASLRARLERLDRQLARLINERAALASHTARSAHDEPALSQLLDDEEHFLQQLVEQNKGPLDSRYLRAIFRELVSGCRALQSTVRVAYLGPQYSYSHLAAMERFGQSEELVPVGGIAAVFEEVYRGHARFGLVPLENSTDGRVADTLDMFTRLPVRICGEVQLRIHHNLLGKGPRESIREIYSRPQALSQCRNWLARHMPQARTIEVTSTSTAAQLAREKPGAAAVASRQAAVFYQLDVLAENIEDNTANVTRFAVIANASYVAPRTRRDKTALMFETEHKVGALADALMVLKRNRLNMTWIESFPVPERPGAYTFFVELEGHVSDLRVRRALQGLSRKALRLEVLGSYEASDPVD